MKRAHVDRQLRALKTDRDEDAAFSPLARLSAHPSRFHRIRGPDDEDGGSDLQFRDDLPVELLAGTDLRVPPDRPAGRLDCGDQRRDTRLVLASVGDEDVTHRSWAPPRN